MENCVSGESRGAKSWTVHTQRYHTYFGQPTTPPAPYPQKSVCTQAHVHKHTQTQTQAERRERPGYNSQQNPESMFRYAGISAGRTIRCCPRLQQQQRRRCVAAIATGGGGGGSDTTKRRAHPVHHAAAFLPRSGSCVPISPSIPGVHAHHARGIRVGGQGGSGLLNTRPPLRHLSTGRGLPPGRSLPEKIFAGVVVAVLAAWGLVFGGESYIFRRGQRQVDLDRYIQQVDE